jgi:hypothetical protein
MLQGALFSAGLQLRSTRSRQAGQEAEGNVVEPSFVEYRDITSEGLLRQSSFKTLTQKT